MSKIKYQIRVLHTNLSVTHHSVAIDSDACPDGNPSGTVVIGTNLRDKDATVAAIRFDEIDQYQWVGQANRIQRKAIQEAEKQSMDW